MVARRFSDDRDSQKKRRICRDGQPCTITVEFMPAKHGEEALLALIIHPLPGYVHLVTNVEECLHAYGEYHISICQESLVTDDDIARLEASFEGKAHDLTIGYIAKNSGYQELADSVVTHNSTVRRLHSHPLAWYRDRQLHISG